MVHTAWSGALFGALMVDCEFIAVASVCRRPCLSMVSERRR